MLSGPVLLFLASFKLFSFILVGQVIYFPLYFGKMKLRTRIPSRARIWSLLALPEEVVLLVLKCLTATELMDLRLVGRRHNACLYPFEAQGLSLFSSKKFNIARPLGNQTMMRWTRRIIRPLMVHFVANFFLRFLLLQVCSSLKQLIDDSSSLWLSASFIGVWPSHKNLPLLQRFVL